MSDRARSCSVFTPRNHTRFAIEQSPVRSHTLALVESAVSASLRPNPSNPHTHHFTTQGWHAAISLPSLWFWRNRTIVSARCDSTHVAVSTLTAAVLCPLQFPPVYFSRFAVLLLPPVGGLAARHHAVTQNALRCEPTRIVAPKHEHTRPPFGHLHCYQRRCALRTISRTTTPHPRQARGKPPPCAIVTKSPSRPSRTSVCLPNEPPSPGAPVFSLLRGRPFALLLTAAATAPTSLFNSRPSCVCVFVCVRRAGGDTSEAPCQCSACHAFIYLASSLGSPNVPQLVPPPLTGWKPLLVGGNPLCAAPLRTTRHCFLDRTLPACRSQMAVCRPAVSACAMCCAKLSPALLGMTIPRVGRHVGRAPSGRRGRVTMTATTLLPAARSPPQAQCDPTLRQTSIHRCHRHRHLPPQPLWSFQFAPNSFRRVRRRLPAPHGTFPLCSWGVLRGPVPARLAYDNTRPCSALPSAAHKSGVEQFLGAWRGAVHTYVCVCVGSELATRRGFAPVPVATPATGHRAVASCVDGEGVPRRRLHPLTGLYALERAAGRAIGNPISNRRENATPLTLGLVHALARGCVFENRASCPGLEVALALACHPCFFLLLLSYDRSLASLLGPARFGTCSARLAAPERYDASDGRTG